MGNLKKLQLLSVIITWEKWKELKKFNDFFSSLSDDELNEFENMIFELEFISNSTFSKPKKSMLKNHKNLLIKFIEYVKECGEIDEEETNSIISLI